MNFSRRRCPVVLRWWSVTDELDSPQPPRPRSARRRGRVRAADRALPPRASAALLPDRRLPAGRRGPAPGDVAGGVEGARAVRGPLLAPGVAVHDRHQPLPQRHARPRPPATGGGRRRVGRAPRRERRRDRVARAVPRRADRGGPRRCARPRCALRGQGVGRARVRVRAPAPGTPPAGGAGPARRARLPRRRGRRDARLLAGLGQQRAPARAGDARVACPRLARAPRAAADRRRARTRRALRGRALGARRHRRGRSRC